MTESAATSGEPLFLQCGELVEVRSKEEILATLDENGALDGMVFMPEMLAFCGQRLRVYRRAHKTCDTITGDIVGRRVSDSVHLENARCDGSAHGGCQAECMLFWKEAWLRRVEPRRVSPLWKAIARDGSNRETSSSNPPRNEEVLFQNAVVEESSGPEGPTYRCQATQLLEASGPLSWWEPKQYLRDWLSGNVALFPFLRAGFFRLLHRVVRYGSGFRFRVDVYNWLARLLGEVEYPYHPGRVTGKTPSRRLDLHPGELARVRSHDEILETVDPGWRNRGLGFAPEMVGYCGGTYPVHSRVKHIINEATGKMMNFKNECIILEDVICRSECSGKRMFCPRAIYPYWREIWLERVEEPPRETSNAD